MRLCEVKIKTKIKGSGPECPLHTIKDATRDAGLPVGYLSRMASICFRWLMSWPAYRRAMCSTVSWPRSACIP